MLAGPSHLLLICARLHRGIAAERFHALGLAAGEEVVLAELWHEDGLTQAELGRRLALRRSTVTTVLRTMERRGLIRRARDDQDGRMVRVHHTPLASALRRDIENAWTAAEQELLAGLSPAERATLARVLRKLRARRVGG